MSKSQELIAKQHPISAGDILGMVAGLAAAAIHIYTIDPTSKLSKMFATEAIPPLGKSFCRLQRRQGNWPQQTTSWQLLQQPFCC